MRKDDDAQVHILEMLTLFWLFFMSATFLIRVNVPDARSVAIDASLESAGEDAITASMALAPELTFKTCPAVPNAGTSFASVILKLDKLKVPKATISKISFTEAPPVVKTIEVPDVAVKSEPFTRRIPLRNTAISFIL